MLLITVTDNGQTLNLPTCESDGISQILAPCHIFRRNNYFSNAIKVLQLYQRVDLLNKSIGTHHGINFFFWHYTIFKNFPKKCMK